MADEVGPKIARKGRPWAREKLEFLRYYLGGTGYKGGGFMMATQSANSRYYLDLFAGSGQSQLEGGEILDGSPLIAAQAQPNFSRLFWVDSVRRNAASPNLRHSCEEMTVATGGYRAAPCRPRAVTLSRAGFQVRLSLVGAPVPILRSLPGLRRAPL